MKYNIILEFAPLREPQYKAYIESWFRLLRQGLEEDNVEGRRPLLKHRLENPELKPESQAIHTMQVLETWLVQWIVDKYHRRHQYNDHVPAPFLKLEDTKRGATPLIIPQPRTIAPLLFERIYLDMLHQKEKKLTNDGIQYNYIIYNSSEAQELYKITGKEADPVRVLYDPRDIGTRMWIISPIDEKTIPVTPTQGWAVAIISYFGSKSISEKTWDGTREFIRTFNRHRITHGDLYTADELRKEMLEKSKQEQRKRRREIKKEELAKEAQEKSLTARLGSTEEVEEVDELTEEVTPKKPKKPKKKKEIDWEKLESMELPVSDFLDER